MACCNRTVISWRWKRFQHEEEEAGEEREGGIDERLRYREVEVRWTFHRRISLRDATYLSGATLERHYSSTRAGREGVWVLVNIYSIGRVNRIG